MFALVATDPDDHGIRFVLTAETEDAIKAAGLAFILGVELRGSRCSACECTCVGAPCVCLAGAV